jgi:dTDP-4-amino-4,6-dideoxygalactose transaminase
MIMSQRRVDLPAIAGGDPVRSDFLSFSQPKLSEQEITAVVETLRSGWLTTAGRAREFEDSFRKHANTKHAVALNSCTAGLFLSLKVLNIGPGDEVVTTPLTFPASVNVIEHCGATPVFADVEPVTGNIDPNHVAEKVTSKTRVILPVHLYGRPCDMGALRTIADSRHIQIVQDCAHAIESEWKGRNVATYGDLACYSFYATKNVTTGEGGMVLTDNSAWADHIRILALHGLDKSAYDRYSEGGQASYDLKEPGYKFNRPDTAAALGVEGMKLLEKRYERRVEVWNRYMADLADLPGLGLPEEPSPNMKHARHLFVCTIDPDKAGLDRNEMIDALAKENIGTGIHFTPVHTFTYYREKYGITDDDLPVASEMGRRVFSLPLTPYLSDDDVEDIIRAVRRIILHYSSS